MTAKASKAPKEPKERGLTGAQFPAGKLRRGAYLADILDRVQFKGETIFIERRGTVVAKLVPSNDSEAKVISDPYLELLDRKTPAPVKVKR